MHSSAHDDHIDFDVLPFSPAEADDVRRVITRLYCGLPQVKEKAVTNLWARVLVSARRAEAALALSEPWRLIEDEKLREAIRNRDVSRLIENKKLRKSLREIASKRSRVGEKLRRLLKSIPSSALPSDMEVLIAVVQGAVELGFVGEHPKDFHGEAYLGLASKLTDDQVLRSIQQALASPFVVGNKEDRKGGRPRAAIIDKYVAALLRIYKRLTSKEPTLVRDRLCGKPTGPLIDFLEAALAPRIFGPLAAERYTPEGIADIVERVKKRPD